MKPLQPPAPVCVALLYLLVAGLLHIADQPASHVPLVRPAGGLGVALLLLGGLRWGAGLVAGAALAWLLHPTPAAHAVSDALSATVTAAVGFWLLQPRSGFDRDFRSFAACRQLLTHACGAAACSGAVAGTGALLVLGDTHTSEWIGEWLRNWMGLALGVLLLAPLVLAGHTALKGSKPPRRAPEGMLVYVLAFMAGQLIFSDWQHSLLTPVANAYWMFLFVTWAGVRLGMTATTGLLFMIALQALHGTYGATGFFSDDLTDSKGFGYWSYMTILALVGLALASYLAELRSQKADLRVAAIAFECQEGLLITDPRGVVLRANQAYLRMSGRVVHEVIGNTSRVLCAHAASAPDPQGFENDAHVPRQNVQRREWHQRRSGAAYPAWVTITPVIDSGSRVTHYVIAITDITGLQQEARQRRETEQRHRDTLVREVHHRIKNNLQGIIGILRSYGTEHPALQEPMTEAIGQVQSISVIHGLLGQTRMDQVRLCELTSAVAASIGALWQTTVGVDIPQGWQPCRVHQDEAVPVALVLNELILNAVKHGGQQSGGVQITLRKGAEPHIVVITISNPGEWPGEVMSGHSGLELVAALMPGSGATLLMEQRGPWAVTRLEFQPPVIHEEKMNM